MNKNIKVLSIIITLSVVLNASYTHGEIDSIVTYSSSIAAYSPSVTNYSSKPDRLFASIKTPEELAAWLSNGFEYVMKVPDEPQTPRETMKLKTGDCDDFAKLASWVLTKKGISNHVLIIRFEGLKIAHAICIWKGEDGLYNFISNQEIYHTRKGALEDAVKKYYPDCCKIEYR